MRTTTIDLPLGPTLIYYGGALSLLLLPRKARKVALLLLPLIAFCYVSQLSEGKLWSFEFLGYELFGRVDRLSMVFAHIFVIMSFATLLYALNASQLWEHAASLFYVGSALGVVFAGDWISLFVFWELKTISSLFLILFRGTRNAYRATFRYLLVHAACGSFLLAGIALHLAGGGLPTFGFLGLDGTASALILLAFLISAAVPPLHAWLPDAYPEATVAGTVFLSSYTTKAAVYTLARAFPGTELLVVLGTIMTIYPIFYAVIENDTRRVLSYSLINQVGFMVTGIGIGTPLALNGAVSHAFCNILFEGLLFMCTGAVLYVAGTALCTELGGLHRTMPLTTICCLVGAASISAFPLFSGFVSKSMVLEAAMKEWMFPIWIGLLFASAGVFHHAGIKIPYFIFFAHDSGKRPPEPPLNMLLAMGFVALLCVLIGVYPKPLYDILPYEVEFTPYTKGHVITQLQLLFFAAAAFYLLITTGLYPPEQRAVNLDTDWFYRKFGGWLLRFCEGPLLSFASSLDRKGVRVARGFLWFAANPINATRIALRRTQIALVSAEKRVELWIRLEEEKLRHMERHTRIEIGLAILILVILLLLYLVFYVV